MNMRIIDIRERTVALASAMRNAAVGFDQMTASAVAIVTDVRRDGGPVVGHGFGSIGRYGHGGLLRERFIPRLLAADPDSMLDPTGGNLDPFRAWDVMMANEKPGPLRRVELPVNLGLEKFVLGARHRLRR